MVRERGPAEVIQCDLPDPTGPIGTVLRNANPQGGKVGTVSRHCPDLDGLVAVVVQFAQDLRQLAQQRVRCDQKEPTKMVVHPDQVEMDPVGDPHPDLPPSLGR
jgi:hypothetical protein